MVAIICALILLTVSFLDMHMRNFRGKITLVHQQASELTTITKSLHMQMLIIAVSPCIYSGIHYQL